MTKVIIGIDPHKLSATIEVVDRHERLLGSDRFSTDRPGWLHRAADLREELAEAGLGDRGKQRRRPTTGAASARGR